MATRNIKILKAIYFFKSLWFFAPVLTLFFLARELSMFQILSLEAALVGTMVLAEVPTGVLADRIGRKNTLYFVIGLYIVGNLFIILTFNYWLYLLANVLFGIAIAFGSGAIEAYVYDELRGLDLQHTMTTVWGSIMSVSLFAGFLSALVGGIIALWLVPIDYVYLLWMYEIGALIAFFLVPLLDEKQIPEDDEPQMNIKAFWAFLKENKVLRGLVLLSVLAVPQYHTMKFLFQPYAVDLGISVAILGVLYACSMLLQAITQKYAAVIEKKIGTRKAFLLATLLPGLMFLMLAMVAHWAVAIIGFFLFVSSANLRDPLFAQYINDHLPSKQRATLLSLISVATSLYLVVTRLVLGWLADISIALSFGVAGAIVVIAALVFRIRKVQTKRIDAAF